MKFTVTSDFDPFLHVSLNQGESVTCESDSMVMMEDNLDLVGELNGGLMNAIFRSFANDESFFQQRIQATRGAGDCLLSPVMSGGIEILDVGATQYKISDGAFMASSSSVEMSIQNQGIGNAIFGGTGGFFIAQTAGTGQVAVTGFGTLFTIEVQPHQPLTIDNGHIVAWDSRLNYELSLSTRRQNANQSASGGGLAGLLSGASGGLLGNVINSVTGGEGVVLKFSGSGKVVLCSRNKNNFLAWIKNMLGR